MLRIAAHVLEAPVEALEVAPGQVRHRARIARRSRAPTARAGAIGRRDCQGRPFGITIDGRLGRFRQRRPRTDQLDGVLAFLKRLRSFLLPFRGVATKYLDNYLRWHRVLEASLA